MKTGDLPHGISGSAVGSRVYVGLEDGDGVQSSREPSASKRSEGRCRAMVREARLILIVCDLGIILRVCANVRTSALSAFV